MGGVSPNSRLYSQSYPSIYSSGVGQGGGGGERERGALEAERDRRRSGIVDLEEACEDEDEDEDEEEGEVDERRRLGAESAGEERRRQTVLNGFFCSSPVGLLLLGQGSFPWTRTRCPGTASPSLSRTGRRRAPTVGRRHAE